jgi:hypothetical protein
MARLPREEGLQGQNGPELGKQAWLQNPPAKVRPEPSARNDLPIWFVRVLVLQPIAAFCVQPGLVEM